MNKRMLTLGIIVLAIGAVVVFFTCGYSKQYRNFSNEMRSQADATKEISEYCSDDEINQCSIRRFYFLNTLNTKKLTAQNASQKSHTTVFQAKDISRSTKNTAFCVTKVPNDRNLKSKTAKQFPSVGVAKAAISTTEKSSKSPHTAK